MDTWGFQMDSDREKRRVLDQQYINPTNQAQAADGKMLTESAHRNIDAMIAGFRDKIEQLETLRKMLPHEMTAAQARTVINILHRML
jgi:hypothetical protein